MRQFLCLFLLLGLVLAAYSIAESRTQRVCSNGVCTVIDVPPSELAPVARSEQPSCKCGLACECAAEAATRFNATPTSATHFTALPAEAAEFADSRSCAAGSCGAASGGVGRELRPARRIVHFVGRFFHRR